MSDIPGEGGHQAPSHTVEHQAAHEALIDEVLGEASTQGVLTNISAITGGEDPTEAEFNALVTRVNVLTQVLRDANLIPT